MDDIGGENIDEPILVPPPGQILRRTARTKIRKSNLPGDGGGHRFASTRRGRAKAAAPDPFLAIEDSVTSEPKDTSPDSSSPLAPAMHVYPTVTSEADEGESAWDRPLSYSEESAIYDSYADRLESSASVKPEDDETLSTFARFDRGEVPPIVVEPQLQPETLLGSPGASIPEHAFVAQQSSQQPPLHHPTPHQYQAPLQVPSSIPPARSPSPGSVSEAHSEPSVHAQLSPPSKSRKEKERKGWVFKWGGDKTQAKIKKEKSKAGGRVTSDKTSEKDVNREKDCGFFSFFVGREKQDESSSVVYGAGPATGAALLGASRS